MRTTASPQRCGTGARVPLIVSCLLGAISVMLLAVGCREQQSRELPANLLARVGDHVITQEDFEQELRRRSRGAPDRYAAPPAKAALLEELMRAEALYQAALALGYDQDPVIMANLKQMIAAKYHADQLAKLTAPEVTAQEIAEYYQQHPEQFGTPEKIRVALIELKVPRTATPEKRTEMAMRAEKILAEAVAAASPDGTFGLLAQQHSDDQVSRYHGGAIGWLRAGDATAPYPPPVVAAMFQLTLPGEFAPVIESPLAFYLVRLLERQPANLRPLTEVREGIVYRVGREKEQAQQEDIFARAMQGRSVRINQSLLDRIPGVSPHPALPAGPVARTTPIRTDQ